jgi:putative toxin-antitoxin system antitoxin component (TIGR02293 family)
MDTFKFSEPHISYGATDDSNALELIKMIRKGIGFAAFEKFALEFPYSLAEWSGFLHLSERSMQRYKKEKRAFDPIQSEKIVEIAMLFKLGEEVFGSRAKFNAWLQTESLPLNKVKPVALIDNSFGIRLVKDELMRIEQGILA